MTLRIIAGAALLFCTFGTPAHAQNFIVDNADVCNSTDPFITRICRNTELIVNVATPDNGIYIGHRSAVNYTGPNLTAGGHLVGGICDFRMQGLATLGIGCEARMRLDYGRVNYAVGLEAQMYTGTGARVDRLVGVNARTEPSSVGNVDILTGVQVANDGQGKVDIARAAFLPTMRNTRAVYVVQAEDQPDPNTQIAVAVHSNINAGPGTRLGLAMLGTAANRFNGPIEVNSKLSLASGPLPAAESGRAQLQFTPEGALYLVLPNGSVKRVVLESVN